MSLSFRYRSDMPSGKARRRPFIPVTFTNGEKCFDALALLDSGADFVAISKGLAETLGLDLSGARKPCVTPSGTAETVETKVCIKIAGKHEGYALTVPVRVLLVEKNDTPPLLGRIGFFDGFEITFNQRMEKVWLKWLN